jgi:hypothetical protein
MVAFRAPFFGGINIIPSSGTPQYIINFLQLRICPCAHTAGNVVYIGAGIASKSHTIEAFFNTKDIGTSWTKH